MLLREQLLESQDFNLNIDLDSINVNDVASPTVKLSDEKCHTSLLSSFLLKKASYFGLKISTFKSTFKN